MRRGSYERLQRSLRVALRRRDVFQKHVEQRVEVRAVGISPLAGSVVLAMPARPDAYSVGSPSASSAAF